MLRIHTIHHPLLDFAWIQFPFLPSSFLPLQHSPLSPCPNHPTDINKQTYQTSLTLSLPTVLFCVLTVFPIDPLLLLPLHTQQQKRIDCYTEPSNNPIFSSCLNLPLFDNRPFVQGLVVLSL